MSFDSFELDSALLAGVADLGFTEPTDIQRDAIPWALEGRDLLACAMTGSGKTAAFALPILQRLVDLERGTTRALVLSPTRELAQQIEQHFRDLAAHTTVKLASIFGGVGYEPQERAFREGHDVLIATPGRLLDHLRRPYANLDGLEVLVLDEADRMLDMGFIPDVRRILRHVPRERQTLFYSATLAKPIQRLAGDMLVDPVTINLERRSAPAEGVRQVVYPVRHELKAALLLHLLERHDVDSALVFTRTKERADLTGGYLKRAGVKVAVIHGDRSQQHRTRVMNDFKAGKYQVLVATDVAARGIDVEELSHVINLDVPNQPDDYIHRVGRTARAGSTGDAMTFYAARELADLHLIEKAIGQKLERIRLDDFDYSKSAAAESSRRAGATAAARRERQAAAAAEALEGDGAVAAEPASNLAPVMDEDDAAGGEDEAGVRPPEAAHDAGDDEAVAAAEDDDDDEASFADVADEVDEEAETDEDGDEDEDEDEDDSGDEDDFGDEELDDEVDESDDDDSDEEDDDEEEDEDDGDDEEDGDDDDSDEDDSDDDDEGNEGDDADDDEEDDDSDDDDDDDDSEDEMYEEGSAAAEPTPTAPRRAAGSRAPRDVLERYADLRERRTGRRWTPPGAAGDGRGTGDAAKDRSSDAAKHRSGRGEAAKDRSGRGDSAKGRSGQSDDAGSRRRDERGGVRREEASAPPETPAQAEPRRSERPQERREEGSGEGNLSPAVLDRYADLREKRRRSGR